MAMESTTVESGSAAGTSAIVEIPLAKSKGGDEEAPALAIVETPLAPSTGGDGEAPALAIIETPLAPSKGCDEEAPASAIVQAPPAPSKGGDQEAPPLRDKASAECANCGADDFLQCAGCPIGMCRQCLPSPTGNVMSRIQHIHMCIGIICMYNMCVSVGTMSVCVVCSARRSLLLHLCFRW